MREHGEFSLTRQGRLLRFRVKGALNLQTVQHSFDAFKQLVPQLGGQTWCCVSDIREWELFTPECLVLAQEINLWCHANGLTHEAVIVSHALMENISKKARPEAHPVETRYFTNEFDANAWLAEANCACFDQTECCAEGG
ncbi:hypothetical protein EZV61_08690 [Corallincola luteus]|uniref:STAS/SEC14 domain-containing protein n=1 Tax=Corallincola luteus TaxID=1775177 RepID=A0ABY2AL18_9GAMM|nr:STAS/SEC14 domain-containing protein [Corallincola luteus]TCI03612.1 hypothetical protein EZV61_08690 [Corallincola luteus]